MEVPIVIAIIIGLVIWFWPQWSANRWISKEHEAMSRMRDERAESS